MCIRDRVGLARLRLESHALGLRALGDGLTPSEESLVARRLDALPCLLVGPLVLDLAFARDELGGMLLDGGERGAEVAGWRRGCWRCWSTRKAPGGHTVV